MGDTHASGRQLDDKRFRAAATHYDKRERIYQGIINVASSSIWLRSMTPRDMP